MGLTRAEIDELARSLPQRPGVYQMRDLKAKILYVGKAKDLRKRVLSYFQEGRGQGRRIELLLERVARVDFLVTGSEKEALILEATLIKRHRPRYNVMLRDDKAYPLIRLSTGDEYPKLSIARRIRKDGHRYFGPYVSAKSARATLHLMNHIFPLRQCPGSRPAPRSRPCLHHQLHHCLAPCSRPVAGEEYNRWVEEAAQFLSGRLAEVSRRIEAQMRAAAGEERFEEAAVWRDKLRAIEKTLEKQVMVSPRFLDQDVFGFAPAPTGLAAAVLFVRQGALVGSRTFLLRGADSPTPAVAGQLISQFYTGKTAFPDQVLSPVRVEDAGLIAEWLSEARGVRVRLLTPQRGQGRALIERARANAESAVPALAGSPETVAAQGLEELGQRLGLEAAPESLEGYDISIHGGQDPVGAMVRFEAGRPVRSKYRNYKIRSVSGQDDVAMLREVLRRRFSGRTKNLEPPDLLVIDGGKGQLNAARAALAELGLDHLAVAALAKTPGAKDADRLFAPGRKNPVSLGRPARFLLMRLRDETHRRAISALRLTRRRRVSRSRLLEIPGIGPNRARALLRDLGSYQAVAEAGVERLTRVPGVSAGLAQRIADYFRAQTGLEGEGGRN